MKTFKAISFTGKRTYYDCTQRVACIAEAAPNSYWRECDPTELPKMLTDEERMNCVPGITMLGRETQSGVTVEYWGWL